MKAQSLQQTTKAVRHVLAKNSPTILTGLGVAGLVSTTIMAVRATPKAMRILEQDMVWRKANPGVPELLEISKFDIIKLTYKCYIPTAIMGTATIACIIASNSINLRRNAALASVFSITETALKEYQAKVVETIGEKKAQSIKDEIAKDKVKLNPPKVSEVIITGKGETLCYDELSGRYFKSDIEKIKRTMNELSRTMLSDMTMPLNDVYYALGLSNTRLGDLIGWHIDDGLLEAEFSSTLTEDGIPCLVLGFTNDPRYIYGD